jgi:hypothetical protein
MAGALDTGMLRYANNAQIDAHEKAIADRQAAEQANNQSHIIGLASHVLTCWQEAKRAKDMITPRILAAQRARAGKYEPTVLAEIKKFGGSEEYARITANKARVAEAWLRDIYIGQTEKPWTLDATPKPSLSEDMAAKIKAQVAAEFAIAFAQTMQPLPPEAVTARTSELTAAEQERALESARASAMAMERTMYDQMIQGGWVSAIADFLNDMVTFPAAHFKGPVIRKRPTMKWDNSSGSWAPVVADAIVPEFERVDPLRCFPSPGATSPQEGYFIEHVSLSRGDLYAMIGVEGFDENAIREVLDEYGRGGLTDWVNHSELLTRADINGEIYIPSSASNVTIDALEYHGPVQGRQLVEWGLTGGEVADPDADYEADVWLIGRWVIKAQLNADPMKRRNYYKTSYEEVPGAYWGLGLVDILADVQGIANAAVRSMVNNMAFAGGPQVGVNVDRLPPGEDITNIYPLKVWQFGESQTGSNTKAVEFFQPQSNTDQTLAVIEKAYSFADDFSLIPRIMGGNTEGNIGRTASGMSMALNAANKGLKGVVSNIDVKILTPQLEMLFNYNMLYNPDQTIKGDAQVVARGAVSLMQMETLQLRRNEFLVATNNPIDAQIVGPEGRAEILREAAKGLQIDVNRVVPPRGSVVPQAMPGQGATSPGAGGGESLADGSAVTDNFSKGALTPTA